MTVILQRAVYIFSFFFLESADANTDRLFGINLDEMGRFLLPDPNNSAESLLLSRLVPPRVDNYHSIGDGEIQRLAAALESSNLYETRAG
jgi:hypothetical protein